MVFCITVAACGCAGFTNVFKSAIVSNPNFLVHKAQTRIAAILAVIASGLVSCF
jgi:hypothetical protein